jgi:hypothetical protein
MTAALSGGMGLLVGRAAINAPEQTCVADRAAAPIFRVPAQSGIFARGTAQAMLNLAINTDAAAPSATDAGAALR